MASSHKKLEDQVADSDYKPLCLDSKIKRIKTKEIPVDLRDKVYQELYPIIKNHVEDILTIIKRNEHHKDSLCHLYEFDLIYLMPLLPKEDISKYMQMWHD